MHPDMQTCIHAFAAGRMPVFWQCTHSARHSARRSARAENGVNSTSSVEIAWNQIKISWNLFFLCFDASGQFSVVFAAFRARALWPCTVRALYVHCACTVKTLRRAQLRLEAYRTLQTSGMAEEANRKRLKNRSWHMSPSASMNWLCPRQAVKNPANIST